MLPLPMIQDVGLGFVMFGLIGERRQKQPLWESVTLLLGGSSDCNKSVQFTGVDTQTPNFETL